MSKLKMSQRQAWLLPFFLTAIRDTGIKGTQTFQAILALRKEVEVKALSLGKRSENARLLLNHLYRKPLVTPVEVAKMFHVTHQTASSLIRDFEYLNILKKWEKKGRSQSYVFARYLALFLEQSM